MEAPDKMESMFRNRKATLECVLLLASVAAQTKAAELAGFWQGTLANGADKLHLALQITKAPDGLYLGVLDVDKAAKIPIDRILVTGDSVRFEIVAVGGVLEGKLNSEGTKLTGIWTQSTPLPIEFTRGAQPAGSAPPKLEPVKPPEATFPLGIPLDLEVPAPPIPFPDGLGKRYLAYELHVTNLGGRDLLLGKLEILIGADALASYEGADLNSLLIQPGSGTIPDRRTLPPGKRAVVFLWISLDAGAPVPTDIRHRLSVGSQIVEGASIRVADSGPLVLAPPLRGSGWLALNGPSNASIHRRALVGIEGKAHIAQRFAIDWVQADEDGKTFTGDAKDNNNYHAYGNEVLAVADARVVTTKDGIPQNVPGASRAVPITLETVGGNHIILDLGSGRFAFYAHLQPGSLRVKVGDRVRRGQVLGLVGNSGNSTEPHLHFHVCNANSPLGSEGVPYALDSFEVLNGTDPGPRQNALPLQNERIRFGQQ